MDVTNAIDLTTDDNRAPNTLTSSTDMFVYVMIPDGTIYKVYKSCIHMSEMLYSIRRADKTAGVLPCNPLIVYHVLPEYMDIIVTYINSHNTRSEYPAPRMPLECAKLKSVINDMDYGIIYSFVEKCDVYIQCKRLSILATFADYLGIVELTKKVAACIAYILETHIHDRKELQLLTQMKDIGDVVTFAHENDIHMKYRLALINTPITGEANGDDAYGLCEYDY